MTPLVYSITSFIHYQKTHGMRSIKKHQKEEGILAKGKI
jgi:hypothetical protein